MEDEHPGIIVLGDWDFIWYHRALVIQSVCRKRSDRIFTKLHWHLSNFHNFEAIFVHYNAQNRPLSIFDHETLLKKGKGRVFRPSTIKTSAT